MPRHKKDTEIDVALVSVKSLFETGRISKMADLSKLYPTKITKAIGLNHSRYIAKLSTPEAFTIKEVIRLSHLIGISHEKVLAVILNETLPGVRSVKEERKLKARKRPAKKAASPRNKK